LGAADVAQFLTRLAVAGVLAGKLAGKRLRLTPYTQSRGGKKSV
jgi:hypothetical protein